MKTKMLNTSLSLSKWGVALFQNQTSANAGFAATAAWWMYHRLISDPLRFLYFVGPFWKGLPASEICAQLTRTEARFWEETPRNMQECLDRVEREYQSKEALVLVCVWFGLLLFILIQLLCRCIIVQPVLNVLKSKSPRIVVCDVNATSTPQPNVPRLRHSTQS